MNKAKILLAFYSFLLVSCVSVQKVNQLEPVYVTNSKQINVLPPENIEVEIDSIMLMEAKFGEQSFSAPVYVIADKTGIFLTILNDFGIDMGVVEYDGNSVFVDCAVIPEKLKGEYLINEFQNAFYCFEALKINLNDSKLNIQEDFFDGNSVRTVLDGRKVIEKINLNADGSVEIENILREYKIKLIRN